MVLVLLPSLELKTTPSMRLPTHSLGLVHVVYYNCQLQLSGRFPTSHHGLLHLTKSTTIRCPCPGSARRERACKGEGKPADHTTKTPAEFTPILAHRIRRPAPQERATYTPLHPYHPPHTGPRHPQGPPDPFLPAIDTHQEYQHAAHAQRSWLPTQQTPGLVDGLDQHLAGWPKLFESACARQHFVVRLPGDSITIPGHWKPRIGSPPKFNRQLIAICTVLVIYCPVADKLE